MQRLGFGCLVFSCGLAACGGGTTFELALVPQTASNQDPFSGASQIDLILDHESGEPERWTLDSVQGSTSIDVEGALVDTRIRVEVQKNNAVAAVGQTGPIDLSNGETSAGVLVVQTDAMAFLEELGTRSFGAGVVAAGDGRFLVFGGLDIRDFNKDGTDNDVILSLDLGALEAGETPLFVEVNTLPEYGIGHDGTDFEVEQVAGRHGHTASLVQSEAGPQVLVAGGGHGFAVFENTTASTFLYDLASGEIEVLSQQQDLKNPRYLHQAATNSDGDVVVMGGFARVEPGFIAAETTFEVYNTEEKDFERPQELQAAGLYGMAVSLGHQGVVYCGGGSLAGGTSWIPDARCVQISLAGEVNTIFEDLPLPLTHASMVALDDELLLVTGGITSDVGIEQDSGTAALSSAFVYSPENGWSEIAGGMNLARARHESVLLPDGRVLLLGGVTHTGLQFPAGSALACAEIFDPATETFAPLGTCTEEHSIATLPTQMSDIGLAVDPEFGILLTGGLNSEGSIQSTALWGLVP